MLGAWVNLVFLGCLFLIHIYTPHIGINSFSYHFLNTKAGHWWIKMWPLQQQLVKFWSIYGPSHLRRVDKMIDSPQMGLANFHWNTLTSAARADWTVEECPLSKYNNALGRIPPSILIVWMWGIHYIFFDHPIREDDQE